MTNRQTLHKRVRRIVVPALLVSTCAVVATLVQQGPSQAGASQAAAAPGRPTSTPTRPQTALSRDDPGLDMNALAGTAIGGDLASSVRVLPDGNVPTSEQPAPLEGISPTTTTRWMKSTTDTTLWSAPDASGSAFTDVPAESFFRVTGPEKGGRIRVYYVGDGLLRLPGDGWVDSAAISNVDAPTPGQVPAVDANASAPLPTWVQAHRASTLWSGPDDNAVRLTDLPQWTFLKVAGIEHEGRLLVNYAGDYATRQPGVGWVDQDSVGPAGDPGVWVTNHRATALWSGVDGGAVKFTNLAQWSKLRMVDNAPTDPNRLEVEFFGDGLTRQPGIAWVSLADIGPITPPVPLPAGVADDSRFLARGVFSSSADFIAAVGPAAQASQRLTGVPASVTVAQAILESDWGRSRLARQGNNLFGIKALNGPGPDGVVSLATWEHTPDGDVVVQAPFRAYATLEQSVEDHGQFFVKNRRYAAALSVAGDPRGFAQAIQDAGYATDPTYASKLVRLMDQYDLYRFDG
ncbi:MAG: glycoside hydrolase family 73 protein [Chloroflexi bacterium]|nr:glycoside hydrolase family 73 protein [Chloroflexota bacterium]